MPNFDTWLWILAAAIPFAMGALGGYLSSNRPFYKWTFWILGLLGVVIVVVAGIRNEHAQSALQTQWDKIQRNTENPPQVTVNIPPSPPPQIIRSDGNHIRGSLNLARIDFPPSLNANPFSVNMHLKNVGQVPIPNVYFWEIATFQPLNGLDSNSIDRKSYSAFLKFGKKAVMEAKKAGHAPTYFAVNDDHWGTVNLYPRQEERDGVIRASTRLYFFAYAKWDDGDYASCRWLQPPSDVHYGNGANLVLHDCVW
jgi:hypothetical protein